MIKNVKKEEVFTLLSKGKTVCAVDKKFASSCYNLRLHTVIFVCECLKRDDYEYFVIEEEGAVAVYG